MEKDKEKIESMKKDWGQYTEIVKVAESKGGKKIISLIKQDACSSIVSLGNYKDMSRDELVSVIARMNERIELLRLFKNSKTNKEVIEEILESIDSEEEKE